MIQFYQTDRTALFIDGPNFYAATRAANFQLDYRKLKDFFIKRCKLIRAYYYTALPRDKEEITPVKPLADWLTYNGYHVITRLMSADTSGAKRFKGDMAVDLTVDVMELAPKLDQVILFSGDGDFVKLINAVQRMGTKVIICSTLKTPTQIVSERLRQQADGFIDIVDLGQHVQRDETSKPEPVLDKT